jgi:hypothetical protein
VYLFTTDLNASLEWVITQFAWRWAIEIIQPDYTSSARGVAPCSSAYNCCQHVA